ncbi:Cold shock protein, CspA family [Flexibacter flexilis DSM 6793]|uniref:Cold shock protein, CspA family n=1 Tax=Flexibacter flexilis DSM 6793 TaxID=927664 RepID=A0A1I1FMQ2_9BACT|nr:NYN domain-containing protein [Flexibacter flexilis]SFC00595.1 Cold shock protein, CspA family [Flexibacter flexilis DSM 6793]
MADFNGKLTRIGVFYDGNYFSHVSNYYNYEHSRKSRLSISGIHEFVRNQVSKKEGVEFDLCKVVDAHYFRGRLTSYEAEEQNKLLAERIFDDILMNEGVVTHYLPLRSRDGKREEKGIDVWLALEVFELAIYKNFNVVVLIASDGDYVPLARKLNTLGIRVMVLGWDFEYTDSRTGRPKKTTTSLELLQEVSYPIAMQEIIDTKLNKYDPIVDKLFVQKEQFQPRHNTPYGNPPSAERPEFIPPFEPAIHTDAGTVISTINNLKNGFGFINYEPKNLFFHWSKVINGDFADLREGQKVEFTIVMGDKGDEIATDVSPIYE